MKLGQLELVKLFPKLVSNGCGRFCAEEGGSAVIIVGVVAGASETESDGDPDPAGVVEGRRLDGKADVEDDTPSSCLRSRRIRGGIGGEFLSTRSSPR